MHLLLHLEAYIYMYVYVYVRFCGANIQFILRVRYKQRDEIWRHVVEYWIVHVYLLQQ